MRQETAKRAAERESRKLKTRLSQREKRNRKRIATVAAVYSIERQVRMPESVMGVNSEEDAPKPRAHNKRVWASVERPQKQVTEEVFQEARRRDPEGKRPWVKLVDGHEGQLEDIHAAIERHGVKVTLILDFIHVLEYLWKAAWCFFVPGCQEPEAWVGERALQIFRSTPVAIPTLLGVSQGPRADAQPPFTDSVPRLSKGRLIRPRVVLKEPHLSII